MKDTFEFTLKEKPSEELFEMLSDVNVETTPSFTIQDTHGNIAEYVKLIRCKDCKHRPHKTKDGYTRSPRVQVGVYAWGEPEYDDDLTCPYVCEDTWYSCIPNDEQYCDRAEPKVTE